VEGGEGANDDLDALRQTFVSDSPGGSFATNAQRKKSTKLWKKAKFSVGVMYALASAEADDTDALYSADDIHVD
jgi:hypothetical protein